MPFISKKIKNAVSVGQYVKAYLTDREQATKDYYEREFVIHGRVHSLFVTAEDTEGFIMRTRGGYEVLVYMNPHQLPFEVVKNRAYAFRGTGGGMVRHQALVFNAFLEHMPAVVSKQKSL